MQYTQQEIDEKLSSPDVNVRKEFALCFLNHQHSLKLTPEQIERGTSDPDFGVRQGFSGLALKGITFTEKQIKRGLRDNYWGIQQNYANIATYVPNAEEIDFCLLRTSEHQANTAPEIFARRNDIIFTDEQAEKYLQHKNHSIRSAFASRKDFSPTAEQFERGLSDEKAHVRYAFARRDDFNPTPAQMERGLVDVDEINRVFKVRQLNLEIERLRKLIDPSPSEKNASRGLYYKQQPDKAGHF